MNIIQVQKIKILTENGLRIKLDLIGRGKRCPSNNVKIDSPPYKKNNENNKNYNSHNNNNKNVSNVNTNNDRNNSNDNNRNNNNTNNNDNENTNNDKLIYSDQT